MAGITGFICLESDNESEDGSCRESLKTPGHGSASFALVGCSGKNSRLSRSPTQVGSPVEKDHIEFCSPIKQAASANNEDNMEVTAGNLTNGSSDGCSGIQSKLYLY